MAWTTPVTRATGYVVLAADWNAEHVNNLLYLHGDSGTIGLSNFVASNGFFVNVAGGYIGYGAGTGATVTQATSRTTAVTINASAGAITTNGTSLANGGSASFAVNNTVVAATDTVLLNVQNNPVTGPYMLPAVAQVAAGVFAVTYANTTGAATTQALVINFALLKSSWT